jgi:hypothetical protein
VSMLKIAERRACRSAQHARAPERIIAPRPGSSSARARDDENFIIVRGGHEPAEAYAVNTLAAYAHHRWRAFRSQTAKPFNGPKDNDPCQARSWPRRGDRCVGAADALRCDQCWACYWLTISSAPDFKYLSPNTPAGDPTGFMSIKGLTADEGKGMASAEFASQQVSAKISRQAYE